MSVLCLYFQEIGLLHSQTTPPRLTAVFLCKPRFEPAWSAKMRAKLADRNLPRNVRLLAFQFAINAPVAAAVVPWAVPWIVAMTNFALAPLPEGLRCVRPQL